MLGDIARVSLAVGMRLFPEQPWTNFGVSTETAASKSPMEQLCFIKYLLPILAQTLAQITQSPLTDAAVTTCAALPHQARRVTSGAWMTHTRLHPSRRTVDETVTVVSHDTPENRAVKSFLDVLGRDCRAIALLAEAEDEPEAATRAADCACRLRGLLRAAWWEEVTPKRGDWALPPTLRETVRPNYARMARERHRYRVGFGFDWDQPLLTLPPRETWRVYETWCLLSVLRALQDMGWGVTSAQEMFAVRVGRLALTLAVGETSRMELRSASGQSLSLIYNRTFAEGRESLTHAMQPDITLSDGERLWILDAKFKPYMEPGEEGEDINQMHAYRDAIIGPSGTRRVAAAWCLYAGLTRTPNRHQLTYGRNGGTSVGALCLRPGDAATQANLRCLLTQWLLSG